MMWNSAIADGAGRAAWACPVYVSNAKVVFFMRNIKEKHPIFKE